MLAMPKIICVYGGSDIYNYEAIYNDNGGTITLSSDTVVTSSARGVLNRSGNFETEGEISCVHVAIYNYGTTAVKDGTVTSTAATAILLYGGTVTIDDGIVTSEGLSPYSKSAAIDVINQWSTVIINGGSFETKDMGIYNRGGNVTVNGGIFTSDSDNPLLNNASGTMIINGAMRINAGEFTGTITSANNPILYYDNPAVSFFSLSSGVPNAAYVENPYVIVLYDNDWYTIGEASQYVQAITLTPRSVNIAQHATFSLEDSAGTPGTNGFTAADIVWTIKNGPSTVAEINSGNNGILVLLTVGNVTVIATVTNGASVNTDFVAEFEIEVYHHVPVANIGLTAYSPFITNQTHDLSSIIAAIYPSNATYTGIEWYLVTANGDTLLTNSSWRPTTAGTYTLKAVAINGGQTRNTNYEQTFTIVVSNSQMDNNNSGNYDNDSNYIASSRPPSSNTVTIMPEETPMASGNWYDAAMAYARTSGLFDGIGVSVEPNETATRAIVIQMLYNANGKPIAPPPAFDDVAIDQWFHDAIGWAADGKVIVGYGNGLFGPNDSITREQMAVILRKYCISVGVDLPLVRSYVEFTDQSEISDWAAGSVEYMYRAGILNGRPGGIFDPKGEATVAEMATVLMNFLQIVNK